MELIKIPYDGGMKVVSVPSFGDSFFILKQFYTIDGNTVLFPSPHSGILFLCTHYRHVTVFLYPTGFRPLIRGFFFYEVHVFVVTPLSKTRFRPLIRGFFFYKNLPTTLLTFILPVSVPSFGDSFFISLKARLRL